MTINNQFIKENAYIVRTIVKQYHYLNLQDDLMQEGYIGLIEAGRRYNPASGILFESYAAWWVRKYVKDAVRRYGYQLTMPERRKEDDTLPPPISFDMPLYEEDGDVITLSDTISDDTDLDEMVDTKQKRELLLRVLTEREQKLVRYYYGWDCEQLCIEKIADEMGLKSKYIYDILERALKKIQKKLLHMQNFS